MRIKAGPKNKGGLGSFDLWLALLALGAAFLICLQFFFWGSLVSLVHRGGRGAASVPVTTAERAEIVQGAGRAFEQVLGAPPPGAAAPSGDSAPEAADTGVVVPLAPPGYLAGTTPGDAATAPIDKYLADNRWAKAVEAQQRYWPLGDSVADRSIFLLVAIDRAGDATPAAAEARSFALSMLGGDSYHTAVSLHRAATTITSNPEGDASRDALLGVIRQIQSQASPNDVDAGRILTAAEKLIYGVE